MAKKFLAIGECMIELATLGEGRYQQGFAGDTFNTAWHFRREMGPGWKAGYLTALGTDRWSDRLVAFMKAEGLDTAHIRRLADRMPGLYLTELTEGERSFSYWRETSAARALADDPDALEAAVSSANALYFSGITLAILDPDARGQLLTALGRAKARGAAVAYDSNIRADLWPDEGTLRAAIRAAARVSTIALPSAADEAALFGEDGAAEVAARYIADGCPEIAAKAGPEPTYLRWPGGEARVAPEAAIRPVDTTGAGDSFNGAYLAARLSRADPPKAAARANAVAARVIGVYGALG